MLTALRKALARIRREEPFGARGERLAAKLLRSKGYRILMFNYRTRYGEIDVVACKGDLLVFVEVKTRESDDFASPQRNVTPAKQHRCTLAARSYLKHYKMNQPRVRFDVVSIVWPDAGKPEIEHFENAFEAT